MALTWMKTLELGVAVRQGVVAKRDDILPLYKYHRVHIYSPETSCRARQPLNSFLNED